MTPDAAEEVLRSWALLHDSGIFGHPSFQEAQEKANGAGTAAHVFRAGRHRCGICISRC